MRVINKALIGLFSIAAIIFLIGPVLAILPLAFTSNNFLTYPIESFSWRWFDVLATDDKWHLAISNSLIIGFSSTLLATALGTLAALGLRRKNLPFLGTIKTIFLLPMVVPAVVLGVGTQIVFGYVGLSGSYWGVIIAHTVLAIPFVVINVLGSLNGINPSLERAAASLGAKPISTFFRVVLPLALPGIASGAVFAFATSLDEVVITLFVAGPNQWTLALQIFSSLRENVTPVVTAAAFIIMIGTIALIGVSAGVRLLRRQQQAKSA